MKKSNHFHNSHLFTVGATCAKLSDRYDSKLEQLKESWMSTITIFHTEKIRDIILKESTTYYYVFLYFWVKWSQFLELTVLILRGKEVPLSCYPNGKWSLHISLVVFKAILFTFVRALPVFDDTFSCSFRRLKSIKLNKKTRQY